LSNIVLGWPLLAAVLHNAGAAALVLVCVAALSRMQAASATQPQGQKPQQEALA
jgi:heme a synthase